ncbi:MAG: ECF-type riboflavin transporter substrate-binding protein [Erysipelotrichaceae bacterium]|nr:ECF-type riboflavin transporter substrate-binding protein [Erysipelotrichaceae bacterium]
MKKSLFSTKTIVATGLGAALFMVLFMFVKVPSPVPETNIQLAYGVSAFLGCVFGPIAGGLIAFIGHALNDFIAYGSPWWSWIIASGVAGAIGGLAFFKTDVESGEFSTKDMVVFNVMQIIANLVAWVVVAPVLDIVIYSEPVNLVFTQGAVAFVSNSICACVVGTLLLVVYAKTRTKKGSLTKN